APPRNGRRVRVVAGPGRAGEDGAAFGIGDLRRPGASVFAGPSGGLGAIGRQACAAPDVPPAEIPNNDQI
ncbi:hypothetical protein, partial [Rhizobium sp. TRM95796]|uniref:hypothetical protein n=1 Tax=Rhizobium sp. TRM95796 TaxID=2979862 RepID=UPI0021E809CC